MLSREGLWKRVSGDGLWPLAWALAGASALPWLVSEGWDGSLPRGLIWGGWVVVALSLPLIRSRTWRLLPLAFLLLWGTLGGLRSAVERDARLPVGWMRLHGSIASPWTRHGDRLTALLQVSKPEMEVVLSLPNEGTPPPAPGTPVALQAELIPIESGPRFLAERPLWRARSEGCTRRAHLASAQVLEVLGPPRPSPLLRLQGWTRRRFEALQLPDGPGRDVWGALVLGLPPAQDAVFTRFAESGTLHTLVVSGLQITLVIAALELLLRRWLRQRAGLAALALGLVYSAVVGFSAPVWRGLVMGAAWALGRSTGWRLPPVLTLHGALGLWLMGHPSAGAEPGFLLAWWALLGLLWGAEAVEGLLAPLVGRAAPLLSKALTPWLATLPLLALFHGGAPIWGAAANLVLVPLISVLTPLALAFTLLPLPGAGLLSRVLEWTATSLLTPFTGIHHLTTGHAGPWLFLLFGWLLLAQAWSRFRRTRGLTSALVVGSGILLATHGTWRTPTTLSLEAMDVGQGDALLLRVPGGNATLVDTGGSPWAARRIARVLSRRGVREPLELLVTHPHGDHAGGWSTLARLWPMASTGVPAVADTDEAWAPWKPPSTPTSTSLVRGDTWLSGAATLAVRWPPEPFRLPDPNMVSLVLRVHWQDRDLWLMGDALAMQEQDLLELGDPGPEPRHILLKAGHHGSRSSSHPEWVRALAPELVFITAGRRNRFGHPHPETLATLQASSSPVWTTGSSKGLRTEVVSGGWRLERGEGASEFIPLRNSSKPPGLR